MKSYAIVGYTYNADVFCPDHMRNGFAGFATRDGMDAEAVLDAAALASGIDRKDEGSFDSGDFPKVVFASMVESSDERCGQCHEPLIGD